jgi:putative FmdB family regulatory protein
MPLYDYVCTACGTRVEVSHGVHAAGPAACAVCGGSLRKAVSAPAVVFKGSGWAKMDARPQRSDKATAASKDEHGDGGTKPAAGSDKVGQPDGTKSPESTATD